MGIDRGEWTVRPGWRYGYGRGRRRTGFVPRGDAHPAARSDRIPPLPVRDRRRQPLSAWTGAHEPIGAHADSRRADHGGIHGRSAAVRLAELPTRTVVRVPLCGDGDPHRRRLRPVASGLLSPTARGGRHRLRARLLRRRGAG